MITLPQGVVLEETDLDVRYRRTLRGLLTRIKLLYEGIYDRFGEEGLKLIREVSASYGRQIAQRAKKGGAHWDAQAVGLFLVKVFNNLRTQGEVTDYSPDRVAIKVPECPYPFADATICEAHTAMERALVQGLNPQLDYRIEKSIPGGDSHCLHCVVHTGR